MIKYYIKNNVIEKYQFLFNAFVTLTSELFHFKCSITVASLSFLKFPR